jgi:hypothetical protein
MDVAVGKKVVDTEKHFNASVTWKYNYGTFRIVYDFEELKF